MISQQIIDIIKLYEEDPFYVVGQLKKNEKSLDFYIYEGEDGYLVLEIYTKNKKYVAIKDFSDFLIEDFHNRDVINYLVYNFDYLFLKAAIS